MFGDLEIECDDSLDKQTILASFQTARQVRELLGEGDFEVISSQDQKEGTVTVGPGLFDALEYLVHGFAQYDEDFDFELELEWDEDSRL